jgi:1-acyl-sn-glycerol-3-phosphate acyltransferase
MSYTPPKSSLLLRLSSPVSAFILRLLGWTVEGGQANVPKTVMLAVPHTTNWDLFYSLLCASAIKVPIWFMMKHSHFWWPAGILWRFLGGVPINRGKSSGVVGQMVEAFKEREVLYLVIPPEGTRKDVAYWKTGFYHIAHEAHVPMWLWFIDYKNKCIGSGELVYTTGDIEADFVKIRAYYEKKFGAMPHCRPAPQKPNS